MGSATEAGTAILPVYARRDVTLVSGRGCRVRADDGREFLDFTSGIAVNALGYGHRAVLEAIAAGAETGLIHTSNLYHTEPGEALAARLVSASFASRVFYCNSGAEATEAALKFARRVHGAAGRTEYVAVSGSFHGRTFGALSVTDRPSYQEPFAPLVPGVRMLPRDAGPDRIAEAITADRTAGVIVEPVQGEGGVTPLSAEFLQRLRDRCDETGAVLIFDEVQCGLGRTGTLFAHEAVGVVPDVLTLAKPLASGFPMGAVLVSDRVGDAIKPGDHATTFGGGPFVARVALATVDTISEPGFLQAVRDRGEQVARRLGEIARNRDSVREVRGRGLMWGIELTGPAADVVAGAERAGLLVLTAGPNVVRLLPPLVVDAAELEEGLSILDPLL